MLKICLTGGPCGGKTSAYSFLKEKLTDAGYQIFFVPECSSELRLNGIVPGKEIPLIEFQKFILDKMLLNEQIYDRMSEFYDDDKIIVFYDRALLDPLAYMDCQDYIDLLATKDMTLEDAAKRYDMVIHLVTAADGAINFYEWNDPNKEEVGNNASRFENPKQAIVQDKATLKAWERHQNQKVFDNSTDFDGKLQRVLDEILNFIAQKRECQE